MPVSPLLASTTTNTMDKASNGRPPFVASNKIHNNDIPNGNGHCLNGFKSGASFTLHLRKMAQIYGGVDGATTLDHKLNQLRACIGVSRPREELMKIATYQSNQIKNYNSDSIPCNGQNVTKPGFGCKKMIAERKEELKFLMTKLDALNAELHNMRQRKSLGINQDPDHKFRESVKQIEHLKEIYKAKSALSVEQNAKITHHQRFLFDLQHDLSSIIKQLEITSRQLYQHDEKLLVASQASTNIASPLPQNTSVHSPAITSPRTKLEYADIIRSSPQKPSPRPAPSYPNYTTTNNLAGTRISNRITPSTLPLGTAIPWHPPKPVFNSAEICKEPAAQHIYARIGQGPSPIESINHTSHEQRLNYGLTHVSIPRPSISVQSTNDASPSLDNFDCGLHQNGAFHGALAVAKSEKFHFNPHSLKSLRRRHSYAEPLQDPLTLDLESFHAIEDRDRLVPEISRPHEVQTYSSFDKVMNSTKLEGVREIPSCKDNMIVNSSYPKSYENDVAISSTQSNPPDHPLSPLLDKLPEHEVESCNAGGSGSSGEESWQTVTTTAAPPTPKSLYISDGGYDYSSTDSAGPGHNDSSDLEDFHSAAPDQVNASCLEAREFYNDMDSFEGDNAKSLDESEVCQLSPRPNTYGQSAIEQYWEESPQPSLDLKSCLRKRRPEESGGKERKVQFDPLALLLDAALEGELDLVIQSAKKAPDPSASNDEGITALHNAICAGHYDIVKFLVDFGCDINAQDSDGWTPLHCAASCNNFEMIKYLVENGASVFATTVSDNETALEKCEEDEYDYHRCASYLYRIQENTGVANEGQVFALYDFQAKELDELTFSMGETLVVTDRDGDENWWLASNLSRQSGFVPKNYIGLFKRILWKPSKDE